MPGTTLQIDSNSPQPMYVQVRNFLREKIRNNTLPAGTKLPSSRALAKDLGVSRNTVLNAYELLAAEGLVRGAVGSGTRVRSQVRIRRLDGWRVLKEAQFPSDAVPMSDPDGNPIYLHV